MLKRPKVFSWPEFKRFSKLNSPAKIQDFIGVMPMNFKITYRSPLMVLKRNKSYCIEGAVLAAAILWYHDQKPLVFVLETVAHDYDHVLALFRKNGRWGAISKTNPPVLRYREPIYKSVRELALSYFHEYFLNDGEKTMRGYSEPIDLRKFGEDWLTSKKSIKYIDNALAKSKHHKILDRGMIRGLRPADKIEIQATKTTRWKK